MLTEEQLKQATRRNVAFARSVGWDKGLDSVTDFLGVSGATANDRRLAQNIERFQMGHPPLRQDGVIGPQTWPVLKKAIATAERLPGVGNSPPAKTSTPNPQRVKALDDWLLSLTFGHPGSKQPWTFYEEVDTYLGPFSDNGYPLAYGKKYCILFNTNVTLARSSVGRGWVRRTTILLQTYLRLFIVQRYREGTLGKLTEAELRQAAFAQHPRAYARGGLTLVVMLDPALLTTIATIPGSEFTGLNASASLVQVRETSKLVAREAVGTSLASLAGPAHTGILSRAAEQDRREFQRRVQLTEMLGALKEAVEAGKLDRVVWLERVTEELNAIEFPDQAMSKIAGQVVAAANARKKSLAERYRKELHFAPDLRDSLNQFDPGWDRW